MATGGLPWVVSTGMVRPPRFLQVLSTPTVAVHFHILQETFLSVLVTMDTY